MAIRADCRLRSRAPKGLECPNELLATSEPTGSGTFLSFAAKFQPKRHSENIISPKSSSPIEAFGTYLTRRQKGPPKAKATMYGVR